MVDVFVVVIVLVAVVVALVIVLDVVVVNKASKLLSTYYFVLKKTDMERENAEPKQQHSTEDLLVESAASQEPHDGRMRDCLSGRHICQIKTLT